VSDRLFELLPAILRVRDAERFSVGDVERRDHLQALLGIIQEQADCVEDDIAGLYEDWFIETCAVWVVPYIGDLLGARLLHSIDSADLPSQRALVANTLRYRRRKGTLLVLEDLARDVSGWRARAVEFFQLLGWTQNLNHLRYDAAPNPYPVSTDRLNPNSMNRVGTVNLRSLDALDRIDGPFDVTTHTVDVRPIAQHEGWHEIRNLGIFLWRLQSYPLAGAHARRSETAPDGFHVSPLGHPAPLFTNPEPTPGDKGPAGELNVPGAIRPVTFHQRPADYYGVGADKSLAIYAGPEVDDAALIPLEDVMCKDLSAWASPPAGRVSVDVRLGRINFAPGEAPDDVTVTFHYAFSADIGGGPYDRRDTLEIPHTGDWERIVSRVRPEGVPVETHTPDLATALAEWAADAPARAIITIVDDASYEEDVAITLGDGQHLVIQADDRNRPHVRFVDAAGGLTRLAVDGSPESTLTIDGLVMEGAIDVDADTLRALDLRHCTLVPGLEIDENGLAIAPTEPSLTCGAGNDELEVTIDRCILGPIRAPETMRLLAIRDSIVDAPEADADPAPPRLAIAEDATGAPGPPTTLERCTIFGEVVVRELTLASEVIFAHAVTAIRRQTGCVRYSYVDDLLSTTPRRFRCQPGLALQRRRRALGVETLAPVEESRVRAHVRPEFESTRYGRPDYAQLTRTTATEVRTGAEDGAEMGAFEHLKQPQREANVRARLDEYMPYGLQPGIIFVT